MTWLQFIPLIAAIFCTGFLAYICRTLERLEWLFQEWKQEMTDERISRIPIKDYPD